MLSSSAPAGAALSVAQRVPVADAADETSRRCSRRQREGDLIARMVLQLVEAIRDEVRPRPAPEVIGPSATSELLEQLLAGERSRASARPVLALCPPV
jgi:hypothetical protein